MNQVAIDTAPVALPFPLHGSAELAARINSYDWKTTSLGPIEQWPQSLRTALNILLGSRFPMQLLWGPDYIHFYNDAYIPIAADKHPTALGQPGAVVWPEIWNTVWPMLEQVRNTGEPTWSEDLLLLINRRGFLEEGYYTFSYGPVYGDGAAVEGIFVVVKETTRRVIGERRLHTVRDLAKALSGHNIEADLCRAAANVFTDNPADLPFGLIYLLDKSGHQFDLAQTIRAAVDLPAAQAHIARNDLNNPWPLEQALEEGQVLQVDNLAQIVGSVPAGLSDVAPERALVLPMRDNSGSGVGCLVAGISPRLQLDDDYRSFLELVTNQLGAAIGAARAHELTREALRVRDDFITIAAHELKSPLTPILGRLQLVQRRLARAGVEQTHIQTIELIRNDARRLDTMIDALLDVSRLRSGQLSISQAPLDIGILARNIVAEIQPTLARHSLVLEIDAQPLPVDGDMLRLELVLRNLISNAVKYSPDGGPIVVGATRRGDNIALSVSDLGLGVSREALPQLFERYYRAHNRSPTAIGGLGVGLFVAYEIVRLHGGQIIVESEPNQGSTFTVLLPARDSL